MAVLRRLAGLALAIGATGAVLAPATPAAERGAGGSEARTPSAPQATSSAADDPVVSTDQDAVPAPQAGAGTSARSLQGDPDVARAAAASNSVTIRDFKFSPKSITVTVGDTVVWTNEDSEQHSATSNGSFDTGLLQKGVSGSVKFDKVGTFAYVCTPHKFMTGTVKVVAKGASGDSGGGDDDAVGGGASAADPSSGDGTSDGNGSAGGAGDGTGTSAASGGSGTASGGDEKLADTGTDSLLVAATGLGLLLCGLGLRLLPRRA